jgi:xylulokinase
MGTDRILSADFGTTSVKIGLLSRDLVVTDRIVAPYGVRVGKGSVVEQDLEALWSAFCKGVRDMLEARAELRVVMLAICGQVNGLVCVDANATPLHPAMIWRDKRGAPDMRALAGGIPSIAGYRVDKAFRWVWLANGLPSLSGSDQLGKIKWVEKNKPDIFHASAKFLDIRDWFVARATGAFVAAADSADLTWTVDSRQGLSRRSHDLLRMVRLPPLKFPEIRSGQDLAGALTERASAELGLGVGTPVITGTSDCTASAIGSGAVELGAPHLCLSSSAWFGAFMPARRLSALSMSATINSGVNDTPLLLAPQDSVGTTLDWMMKSLFDRECWDPELLEALGPIKKNDPYFVPWFVGEKSPVEDERLRATFWGIDDTHDRAAMGRAVVDGIAQNLAWAWHRMRWIRGLSRTGPMRVVGGVARNTTLVQALADTLDMTVERTGTEDAGVLGIGLVGAAALGWTSNPMQAAASIQPEAVFHPDPTGREIAQFRQQKFKKMRRHVRRLSHLATSRNIT